MRHIFSLIFLSCLSLTPSFAKVSDREASDIDPQNPKAPLTCSGAEKAGDPAGVPPWNPKWRGTPPHLTPKKGIYDNPYANEKLILIINKSNYASYANRLSPGQQALLKKYADYEIHVYPSHRDFNAESANSCEFTLKNAKNTVLIKEGLAVDQVLPGGLPFPLPKSGLEALWNGKVGGGKIRDIISIYDTAMVNQTGNITMGKAENRALIPIRDGEKWKGMVAYFFTSFSAPERMKGMLASGWENTDHTNPRKVWHYDPALRRVREMPDIGYDFQRGSDITVADDVNLFNGSPVRYNWTLKNKRLLYIPYNNYLLEDPKLQYSVLLTPRFPNPKLMRFELHRAWELEATLKPGMRHTYAKRVMFLDEDTWQPVLADYYDARGQLWRTAWQNITFLYDIGTIHTRNAFYIDLISGNYQVDRLWQNNGPIQINTNKYGKASDYGPNALRSAGK